MGQCPSHVGQTNTTTTNTTTMPAKKKKVQKKSESCIFGKFSSKQIAEFKEGFLVMDKDKDGLISQADIASTFAELGRPGNDDDFAQMVADAGEPDDDEAVVAAFQSFEGSSPGTIDPDQFKTML